MLITLIAGAFVLGVVILVHEVGHFVVAKLSGVYVKTFSIGFGKKILRKRIGETDYALSALPFGGYVKFAGEVDVDEEAAKPDETPTDEIPDSEIPTDRYFRNYRIPIKSAVIFAGPLMNYLLAILVYTGLFFTQGLQVIPTTTIGEVSAGSPADSCGLKAGDRLLAVDETEVGTWRDVIGALVEDLESPKVLKLMRGGESIEIGFKGKVKNDTIQLGLKPHISAQIGRVKRDGPAHNAGMRTGAVIEAINDTTITSFYDIEKIIHSKPEIPIAIKWSQNGETRVDTLVPEARKIPKEGERMEFETVGQIGIGPYYEKKPIGFLSSLQMGTRATLRMTRDILSFLKLLFTGKAGIDSLGGPILVTQMAGEMARWGFNNLLYLLAFFSINVCIINLLPILPFDGGHLALFLYEGTSGREVNRRIREILTQFGFILIILLMVYVVILDVSRCAGYLPSPF